MGDYLILLFFFFGTAHRWEKKKKKKCEAESQRCLYTAVSRSDGRTRLSPVIHDNPFGIKCSLNDRNLFI